MKKVLLCSLMLGALTPLTSSAATPGTYVGAGFGHFDARFKDGKIGAMERTRFMSQNASLSNSGWGGTFFAGKLFQAGALDWFVQGGASFDNVTLSREINPSQVNNLLITDKLSVSVKREGVLDLTAGISKTFKYDVRASLSLGILLSRFKVKFAETPYNRGGKLENTEYLWGIAPGVSLEKSFGPVSLGISYSYQMFEDLKTESKSYGATQSVYSTKQTPVYHTVMATIKKMF